jgi:hypothetical protein
MTIVVGRFGFIYTSSVSVVLSYGLGDRGSVSGSVNDGIFFSSPPHPDRA